eukprot:CAMPEP_0119009876 /NCGR_PEP_ID=MMETSP1176-20130426/4652_1 /TAXON_ID=265551 /ORGANISM="Synedropsis recta cf, Strain CCMP1620" /LENGTH=696 /DNA_ID=CAMNT_0006962457 /DNA_START=103 /DNA_END=2193 /DNA_ORIENTATION=+
MRMSISMQVLLFLSIALFAAEAAEARQIQPDEFVDCEVRTVLVKVAIGKSHSVVNHRCISYSDDEEDDGMVYDLPEWLLAKYADRFEAESTSHIRIHGSRIQRNNSSRTTNHVRGSRSSPFSSLQVVDDTLIVASEENTVVEFNNVPFHQGPDNNKRRQLSSVVPSTTGTSSVLFVRITTKHASVSLSAATMSDRAFGSHEGTLKSTYADCSFGKLNLQPATSTTRSGAIVNGVVELSLPDMVIEGVSIRSLENSFSTALVNKIGSISHFHHVAYCVPSGSRYSATVPNWLAYGYLEDQKSFFNDEQCGFLSNLVHEIGHNLGLGHSGDKTLEYGDGSGMMGFGNRQVNGPIMCFNAPKNWQLGWYSDKSSAVSVATNAWNGRLYGYPDYQTAPGNVLIQVGDIFLQYNRITTINKGTKEMKDQIAIARSPNTNRNAKSVALAGIDTTSSIFTINDFSNKQALVIEVCDMVKVAHGLTYFDISIRLSNQVSRCGQPASPATPRTRVPTSPPTRHPISYPTKRPTPSPTMRPTASVPIKMPSSSPSGVPTMTPSTTPTANPTTSSPTSHPSSQLICDDNNRAQFVVNETSGYSNGCLWLAARPEWQEQLCVETHAAYTLCEETCGSCTDNCEDTEGGTFEHRGVNRPCSWLSLRSNVQQEVCVPGHMAMEVCQETCNVCDIVPDLLPDVEEDSDPLP